jgi:CRP-like cAMP-binding protein
MSFLEDAPASASVTADGEIEAYRLDQLSLQSLFELFPHLASRFYRSLATNLSRRLRELIGDRIRNSPQRFGLPVSAKCPASERAAAIR